MGIFGFIGETLTAAVKVAVTPIALVVDATNVVVGNEPTATKDLMNSVGESVVKAADEITGNTNKF